jgi:RND family efflux transporter MFP subunit
MKPQRIAGGLAGALLGVLGVAMSGCQEGVSGVAQVPPAVVTVARPVVRDITDYFEFTGQTAAVEEVEIRSRVTGYLQKVGFQDGAEVKKGDLLFEIDPRPFLAELDREASQVVLREATLKFREAELARTRSLLEKQAISRTDFDQSVAAESEARAAVGAAKATMESARLNFEFTKIKSPIDGRISRTKITAGNLVSADVTPLTTVISVHPVYVYFSVDERTMLQYQKSIHEAGLDSRPDHVKDWKVPVLIGLANETGYPRQGILDYVDNKLDPGTGTIRSRAVFENTDHGLTAGLFVRVKMPFGDAHKATMITERALGTDQGQKFVYVVNARNEVEDRLVKLGSLNDGLRVILDGLTPDEQVIVNGLQRVRPGVKVDPKPGEMVSAPSRAEGSGKPADAGKPAADGKPAEAGKPTEAAKPLETGKAASASPAKPQQ